MSVGRVVQIYKNRLACSVSTTVVGDGTTTLVPVDASVVDFDEEGGQFQHQPTSDIYSYTSVDIDAETITLSAGLPVGKTLSAGHALYVYPRSDDYIADVAIDDVAADTVSARVPQMLRAILREGDDSDSQLVQLEATGEEWEIVGLAGQAPGLETGVFYPGDIKATARNVAGGGVLIDGGWLKADGSSVLRSKYASLFNEIGTTYGSADINHFNLPDLRDRTIFGTGTQVSLGQTDGAALGDRGPGHTHAIPSVNHNGASNTTQSGVGDRVQTIGGNVSGSHNHSGLTGAGTGTGNPIGYIGIHYLIKV